MENCDTHTHTHTHSSQHVLVLYSDLYVYYVSHIIIIMFTTLLKGPSRGSISSDCSYITSSHLVAATDVH